MLGRSGASMAMTSAGATHSTSPSSSLAANTRPATLERLSSIATAWKAFVPTSIPTKGAAMPLSSARPSLLAQERERRARVREREPQPLQRGSSMASR